MPDIKETKEIPKEEQTNNVPGTKNSSVPAPSHEALPQKPGRGSGGSELGDIEGGSDECNQAGCS